MPIQRLSRFAFFLTVALVALPALGAEIDRIVSFSAGDPPPCSDGVPEIASQPGGSFLLLWSRNGCPPGTPTFNRALRFDAAGRPLGAQIALWQGWDTTVVALPDGGFVAASARESLSDQVPQGVIRLHRLDPLGRPVGEPIVVVVDHDEFVTSTEPRLAVAPNGRVAIVWTTLNWNTPPFILAWGRFYDPSLAPLTEAFPLSPVESVVQGTPDIAFADDSTALAIWAQASGFDPLGGIFGRRFDSSGHPMSEAFPISPQAAGLQKLNARVVPRTSGGWWAAWSSFGATDEPIEARLVRLGPDGLPLLAEQSLGLPQSEQSRPALGTDGAGHALLLGRSLDGKIVGRLFDSTGLTASTPFALSEATDRSILSPTLSEHGSALTAAWTGFQPPPIDSSDLFGAIFTTPCLPGKSAACLGPDGRYGVEVAWQLGAASGTAKPLPLAGNVATFGLRNAADHDVTVLLSGSGSRDLTFAATTGAAIEIRVTDKTTGEVRTFNKPAGRFASGRFPNALPSGASLRVTEITREMTTGFNPPLAPELAVGETCVPTSRALCLLGGRFRAELLAGQYPNPALAITRTDKSGAFALPRASESPLVTLTMIDGRANNGKFWVYLGGLSPSGYRVKITDLSTGAAKTYANPVGRLDSRADRTAF